MKSRPVDTVVGRCAVYDKARMALAEHLRDLKPPLPAREVARRRLELEASIEIIEQESLKMHPSVPEAPVKFNPVIEG